jgi:thioesterase domain-containing protein
MQASDLEDYLYQQIPISKQIGISVMSADTNQVILAAPLKQNINHCDTVFGGSASAVAILATWSLIHLRLSGNGITARIVIQRNTMEYTLPISGDFTAKAINPEEPVWRMFMETIGRKGKARIQIKSILEYENKTAGQFTGTFVAFRATSV